ncbi:MAG: EF-hand domain-containing protein [Gammaproteobacteria bacterium]
MQKATCFSLTLLIGLLASPAQGAEHHHGPGFAHLDTDGDGRLSAAEMAQMPSRGDRSAEQRFARLDTDGDGYLTQEEIHQARQGMRKHRPRFEELDTDGDGQLSIDEMGSLPARDDINVNERFARLDGDNNGYVSHDELRTAARKRHQARHGADSDNTD